jgi:hypothetical protein
MAMRVPASDYEMGRPDPGVVESEFDKNKDLWEGINGRDKMDSRFENTERTQVLEPRGDQRGRPMPRDAVFRQADNHGEWGLDYYTPRLECGMDGPISTESYKGAGLPTRLDLSSPANRNHPGSASALPTANRAPISEEWGMNPKMDGIDGDN